MRRVKDQMTAMLNAVTFAEADEPETAMKFLNAAAKQNEIPKLSEEERLGVYRATNPNVGQFEKSMSAAAFAEAGEFEVAREILSPETRPHTVLLVIEKDLPNVNAIEYTVSLCKRIGAIMDIIVTSPPGSMSSRNVPNLQTAGPHPEMILNLAQFLREREITYHMYMLQGDLVEKLGDYVRQHKEVTTVVYDSSRNEESHSKDDTWHKLLDIICTRLSIPLITVFQKRTVKLAI
jgi:hypothetical protein